MKLNKTALTIHDSKGLGISALLVEPSTRTKRIVVLCHGFLSNKQSNTNRRLTELLVEKGISTFCFDWFGMGGSEGRFADLTIGICCDQLKQTLSFVHSKGYSCVGLVGSSYGGLIATLVAAHDPFVAALGLKCPVPDFPEMLRLEFGQEAMNRWKSIGEIPDIISCGKPIKLCYSFYKDCLAYDAYAAAQTITAPTLIVHGDQDEIVPFHQIKRLEQSLVGEKRLNLLPGANHHFGRPDDFRKMTALLVDWMTEHLTIKNLNS